MRGSKPLAEVIQTCEHPNLFVVDCGHSTLGPSALFDAPGLPGALEQLRARGIAPSWGPVTREKYARAEIRDPDGNAIELRQWL